MNTRNYQEQKFTEKILNEHLKTKPKWLVTCGKVNRYTRAGQNGKFIICPHCNQGAFEEMMGWSEDIFLSVAEDFDLEFEGV